MNNNFHYILLVIAIYFAPSVSADTYVKNMSYSLISQDGKLIVNIVAGDCDKKTSTLVKISSSADKNKYTNLINYKLNSCYMPSEVLITNDQKLIVIYDYVSNEKKKILNVYNKKGKVFSWFSLSDIYSSKKISQMLTSVSAIYWKCDGLLSRVISRNRVEIHDSIGGLIRLNTNTGKYQYLVNPYAVCKKIAD